MRIVLQSGSPAASAETARIVEIAEEIVKTVEETVKIVETAEIVETVKIVETVEIVQGTRLMGQRMHHSRPPRDHSEAYVELAHEAFDMTEV